MTNTATNPSAKHIPDFEDLLKPVLHNLFFTAHDGKRLNDEQRAEAELISKAAQDIKSCHISYIATLGKILGDGDISDSLEGNDKQNIGWLIHSLANQYIAVDSRGEYAKDAIQLDDILKARGVQS